MRNYTKNQRIDVNSGLKLTLNQKVIIEIRKLRCL